MIENHNDVQHGGVRELYHPAFDHVNDVAAVVTISHLIGEHLVIFEEDLARPRRSGRAGKGHNLVKVVSNLTERLSLVSK